MALYCGIDLHSTNHLVTIIDEEDRRLYEKRLSKRLEATLQALAPIYVFSIGPWFPLRMHLDSHGTPASCA
jgi:hypothetical protein